MSDERRKTNLYIFNKEELIEMIIHLREQNMIMKKKLRDIKRSI